VARLRSFGDELKRLRTRRKMTKYELSDMSGVPQSNVLRFESGERGVPEFGTVFSLGIGLDLPAPDRKNFMKFALSRRLIDEVDRWCIYYFLASVDDDGFDDIVRFINLQRRRRRTRQADEQEKLLQRVPRSRIHANDVEGQIQDLSVDRAYDVLVEIAENPDFVEQRRKIASQILRWVKINVEDGSVGLISEDGDEILATQADEDGIVNLARMALEVRGADDEPSHPPARSGHAQ
jgi:transcriptional regulator with XRE-family HTH domain